LEHNKQKMTVESTVVSEFVGQAEVRTFVRSRDGGWHMTHVGGRGVSRSISQWFVEAFLPQGFPQSVSQFCFCFCFWFFLAGEDLADF
jgi:hypothetical protein